MSAAEGVAEGAGDPSAVTVRKRSIAIAGHRTSISLESAFWDALRDLGRRRGLSLNALVASVDAGRRGNLSSALRLAVLDAYRSGELPADAAAGATGTTAAPGS